MGVIKRTFIPHTPTSTPGFSTQDSHLIRGGSTTDKVTLPLIEFAESEPISVNHIETFEAPVSAPMPSAPSKDLLLLKERAIADIEALKKKAHSDLERELSDSRQHFFDTLESEKSALFKQAHTDGFEQGKKEGLAQFEALSADLFNAISELKAEKKKLFDYQNQAALELGLAIGEKVIQHALTLQPDTISSIVHEALSRVTDKDKVYLKVHPNHVSELRKYRETFRKELSDFKQLDIIEDSSIPPGGCVIETALGYIDSNVSTKLDTIRETLETLYNKEHPDSPPIHLSSDSSYDALDDDIDDL